MRSFGHKIGRVAVIGISLLSLAVSGADNKEPKAKAMVGAYYFDGWAGKNRFANDPQQPWAKNAPSHLTKRMLQEFSEREPIWGWRDDSLEIMEKQIDLAADNGIDFFLFCWYWSDDKKPINTKRIMEDSKHTCLDLFLKAKNNHRMKFALLVANHAGHEITGTENWKQAGEFWMPYLKHKQHVTVGGKPLIVIFNAKGSDKDGFAAMQESAKKAGLTGLALAGCSGGSPELYTHRTHYNINLGYTAGAEQHTYTELIAGNVAQWRGTPEQPYMPIITAGWDKRPWEGPDGLNQKPGWFYPDRKPEQLAEFMRKAIEWMDKHPEQTTAERIVLIYAWNEFGEGGYIAPTKGDPDGQYLKALKSVLKPGATVGERNTLP